MGKKRILLVEDDPVVLKVTKRRLEHEHFAVVTAVDGEEAVTRATANGPVDLVLLDLKLPKFDGFEVCKRLKANPATAAVPIIIFTASSVSWQRLIDQCVDLGVTALIRQPFQSEELLKKIRQALHLDEEGPAHG